jgi:hypothetical protein
MKEGAIYLLSRRVTGDHGEDFMQNVSVFAPSASDALQIVSEQFQLLRKNGEDAYQALPKFAVEKVSLDNYKMITAGVTK